jgi:molecular chaperone DnaK
MPQIEVTFNVDVNGILTVSAKDLGTSKESKITVQNAGGLNKDEIEKMKREAESHAAEDKKRREVIDLKNQAEAVIYQTERQLKEHGDKVGGDVRGNIESALNNVREAAKSDDADRIKKSLENLQQASFKLGEAVYKSAGPKGAGPGGAPDGGPGPEAQTDRGTAEGGEKKKDEDVIDAEYEVKE